ncbi:alpha/beta fold hydrolase [Paraburkholderia humisilvae]|uniref:AB hydrolase superfamily protein YdjP n=1 Tax=Paraburkholderia humisilvae TaxID=627669 RepID=A0A6J5CW38_9BURK|nr:alpha/beta hydrolase [Paraburkholderia humisilvae]CAB3745773.1 AB hydrolase superfamily protein YdjP [Paraburkholderia humisilvae]
MLTRFFNLVLRAVALAGILFGSAPNAIANPQSYTVTSSDGVRLAVQESGNPDGPAVIFIHGLLGSRLNWDAQVQSARLQRYRIITYDLRGHGLSDKPLGRQSYQDGRRWADDLAAVIRGAHAKKPVLVGWSLGGVVMSNYLAAYGDHEIAGAVYVDGVIELAAGQIVAHPDVYRDMTSSNLRTHLDGERTFLSLCFNHPPDADTFDRLLANAAMASWDMQSAVPSMSVFAVDGLGNARVPLMLIYGQRDSLVDTPLTVARAIRLNPRFTTKVYADSGHAPFMEEPERFNRDLDDFIASTTGHGPR